MYASSVPVVSAETPMLKTPVQTMQSSRRKFEDTYTQSQKSDLAGACKPHENVICGFKCTRLVSSPPGKASLCVWQQVLRQNNENSEQLIWTIFNNCLLLWQAPSVGQFQTCSENVWSRTIIWEHHLIWLKFCRGFLCPQLCSGACASCCGHGLQSGSGACASCYGYHGLQVPHLSLQIVFVSPTWKPVWNLKTQEVTLCCKN